jgi:Patatin-like phospholipase
LHTLRTGAAFAAGLMLCTLSVGPATLDGASAQTLAQARKKVDRKSPAPKEAAKEQHERERTPFTVEEDDAAVIPGIPDARVWGDSETAFARLLPQASGPWLAISGGGSDGAYGAGVLTGWTQSGTRPEFAVVTGASIGALIAPFAFLGSRYDEDVHKNFTTIGAADIFEDRVTRDSLFDYWPLKRQVEQQVTAKLLAEIAAEHARGRRLFVATTNLDAGRRVIWNMGAIAARGDEAALKLFRAILLASSSIPGFFSPVLIEVESKGKKFHEMHSDGTITAPFFVVPEGMLSATGAARPPLSQLYVLVNSKLGPEFKMSDRNVPGVLGRSIAVALTAALRAEIMLVYAGAQRLGISVRVARVDQAFDFPSRGPFDGKYMQALYEFGVAAGKKGTAFDATLPELSMHRPGNQ